MRFYLSQLVYRSCSSRRIEAVMARATPFLNCGLQSVEGTVNKAA